MRAVVIAIAALVTAYTLVEARRSAAEVKKTMKRTNRKRAVGHAARQKPGQVIVPKMPKIKRAKR